MILVFLYFITSKFDQFTRKLNSFQYLMQLWTLNAISFNEPVVNCVTSPPSAEKKSHSVCSHYETEEAVKITMLICTSSSLVNDWITSDSFT